MLRKLVFTLGTVAVLTLMASCRPSEDNKEYEPKVARIEVIAAKMANGTASLSEMTEAITLLQDIAEVEEKEGKVLSSGQVDRIEAAADKISKK